MKKYKWIKIFVAGLIVCAIIAELGVIYRLPTDFSDKTYQTDYKIIEYRYSAYDNFITLASMWLVAVITMFTCSKDVKVWLSQK